MQELWAHIKMQVKIKKRSCFMRFFQFKHRKLFMIIASFVAVQVACADDLDLSELSLEQLLEVKVTSASKYEQSTSDAPSAVQIITREEIKRHGWRTISEALLALPGFYISNDHAYDFLGARGFLIPGDYNTRFLLLVDGERNNDNIYQQALTGEEGWLDMSVVERIEYIPGPGSAIYGSNAMFGVINIITRSAEKIPLRKISTYVSQQGLAGVSMLAGQTFDKPDSESVTRVFMQYSNENKAGRDRTYADPLGNLTLADGSVSSDGVSHGLDTGRNQRLFMKVDHGEWSISLLNHERQTTPSSALYMSVFDDPALKIVDAGTQVSMSLQHALSTDSSVYARLGYTDWAYLGTYGLWDSTNGYYHNFDDVHGQIVDGEFRYQTRFGAHHVLGGVEFSDDLLARQQNYNSIVLTTPDINVNTNFLRKGYFVQDEFHISESWLLNLGLRMDTNGSAETSRSPRLGVIWHVNDQWNAKLLSGRAYRSPNGYEAQYGDGINYLSNPELQGETIQTSEGVLEWQSNKQTRWMLSVYQNRLNNLIQQVDTGSGLQYQNGGWIQVRGSELSVEKHTESNLNVRASMALNKTTNDVGNSQENSPDWVGKASMNMPIFKQRAYWAVEIQVVSSRNYTWNSTPYSVTNETLANTTLTFPDAFTKGLQAQIRISNVFNNDIQHPASSEMPTPKIPQDGRNLLASISYAF